MKAPLFSTALALIGAATLAFQEPAPGPAPETPLAAGDVAPGFTLNDHDGQLFSLGGDTQGWTLIAFYPKALTGG